MASHRFYEAAVAGARRSAPAALRNREPIAEVLRDWLPEAGLVLELASGTGEHAVLFAERFPHLDWQPSDIDPGALESIRAWRQTAELSNLRDPLVVDAQQPAAWPIDRADAVLSINMVHISPWPAALGLIDGAAKVLDHGGALILYGPWLTDRETAPSNLAFDADLKRRNQSWGLRKVADFSAAAAARGFALIATRDMPANNLMLLYHRSASERR